MFDMRDDLRNRDFNSVDMSTLYPSTIHELVRQFNPYRKLLIPLADNYLNGTSYIQCEGIGS